MVGSKNRDHHRNYSFRVVEIKGAAREGELTRGKLARVPIGDIRWGAHSTTAVALTG
jgi:hypothetical protein